METALRSLIEPLEARIAPAVLLGKVLTYTDTDGDLVTIKLTTKATLTSANFLFDTPFDTTGAQVLQRIVLNAVNEPLIDGTAIAMTVKTPSGMNGNGRADVGAIDATGHDLGAVSIEGDLGRILAGNADDKPALASLSVYSLGVRGTSTQPSGGNLVSRIFGSVGPVSIADDLHKAVIYITKAKDGPANLGAVTIGGDLIGGATTSSGQIAVIDGALQSVSIKGNLAAGTAAFTGYIYAAKSVGAVTIGGDFIGGGLFPSGAIFSGGNTAFVKVSGDDNGGHVQITGKLGLLQVGGDLKAMALDKTGYVFGSAGIGTIKIGGDFVGADANLAGVIYSGGNTSRLTIGGDVLGGAVQVTGALGSTSVGRDLIGGSREASGTISAGDGLGSITIGRDITGGSVAFTGGIVVTGNLGSATVGGKLTGTLDNTGRIAASGMLKAATVGGDVQGGPGEGAGLIQGTAGIGAVTIKGSVNGAAGQQSGAIESSGSVGSIRIMGDLRGGSAANSGYVSAGPALKSLRIDGDFIGGSVGSSGLVGVQGLLGSFTVGKSMTGGDARYAGAVFAVRLGTATIGGDLVGGAGPESGAFFTGKGDGTGTGSSAPAIANLTVNGSIKSSTGLGGGAIYADGQIAALTVRKDIVGSAAVPVIIGAVTTPAAKATKNLSIVSVKILGSMTDGIIRAGTASDLPERPDGQIGAVSIGGDFTRSSIVASARDVAGDGFGNGDDTRNTLTGDNVAILSSIASVVIKGAVVGTASPTEHFGLVAEVIGSITIGKTKIALTKNASNDFAVKLNTDGNTNVVVNELPALP